MPTNVEDHPCREFERAGWAYAAASHAGSFEATTRLFARPLHEAIVVGPRTRVLDVACGSGHLTAMAASLSTQLEGIDFSQDVVDSAAKRYPALQFQQADAEALPFVDGAFDAVAIGFGVHHFPFPLRALVEDRRVLRTGRRLGFTVWVAIDEHMIQKVVVDAVRKTGNSMLPPLVSSIGRPRDDRAGGA